MKPVALMSVLMCLWIGHAVHAEGDAATPVGKIAPEWSAYPGVDGKTHSSSDLKDAKATLVVFLCNHCPCAKSYEARFKKFVNDYQAKGVRVVAFNADQSENLEDMKDRAKESQFNFDYLRDEKQQFAKSIGAKTTPHVFLLNERRQIIFAGAFDDDMRGLNVKQHYVKDALEDLLQGRAVKVTESRLCGCAIHYEK